MADEKKPVRPVVEAIQTCITSLMHDAVHDPNGPLHAVMNRTPGSVVVETRDMRQFTVVIDVKERVEEFVEEHAEVRLEENGQCSQPPPITPLPFVNKLIEYAQAHANSIPAKGIAASAKKDISDAVEKVNEYIVIANACIEIIHKGAVLKLDSLEREVVERIGIRGEL